MLLLLVPLAMLPGCRGFWTTLGIVGAAGVGAAAVYYAKGDLEAEFDESLADVYQAARETMEDRGYLILEEDTEIVQDEATVVATVPDVDAATDTEATDDGTKVKVGIGRADSGRTSVSIRVGVFGDEALSRAILADIEEQLGSLD